MPGQKEMVKIDQLQSGLKVMDFNYTKMSEALGVSASTIGQWMNKKEMPKLAALAVEGLLRRRSQESIPKPKIFLVMTDDNNCELLTQLLTKLDIKYKRIKL